MSAIIPESIINALSWTMVHSIWQGTIVAIILYILLKRTSIERANLRYNYAISAFTIFAMLAIGTFIYFLDFSSGSTSTMQSTTIHFMSAAEFSAGNTWNWQTIIGNHSDLIFQLWLIGVILFSLKFILGYGYLLYLRSPGNTRFFYYLNDILTKVQNKIGFIGTIEILASNKISTPIVVGWIKPAILLPVALVNGLTTQEIEAIIVHEIAHIKRFDWLINLVQSIMEILFYFNPAMWWISSQIRKERENACDDWALAHGYNKLDYANLLYKVKEIQLKPVPGIALGFADSKNQTTNRIKRILGNTQNQKSMKDKILAVALILFVGIGFAFTKANREKIDLPFLSSSEVKLDYDRAISIPELSTQAYTDTIPKGRNNSKISIVQNGKTMTLEKENGEITKMEVDGKEIDPSQYDEYMEEFGDFDFGKNGGFQFRSGPGLHGFNFGNGGTWEGFDQDDFNKMFKNLDSMKVFNFDDFSRHFKMDSLNGQMLGMEDIMEQLRESLKDFDFKDMEELRNFNFGHDFDFMKDFDFGQGYNFDFDDHPGFSGKSGKISDKIGVELSKDGLLKEGEESEIELTSKHLKINGKKQSSEVFEKYKTIFEDYSGIELTDDSKINLTIEGKPERKRGLRRI